MIYGPTRQQVLILLDSPVTEIIMANTALCYNLSLKVKTKNNSWVIQENLMEFLLQIIILYTTDCGLCTHYNWSSYALHKANIVKIEEGGLDLFYFSFHFLFYFQFILFSIFNF